MDDALARQMHETLRHKPGERPSSCPICEAHERQNRILADVPEDAIQLDAPSIERDRG